MTKELHDYTISELEFAIQAKKSFNNRVAAKDNLEWALKNVDYATYVKVHYKDGEVKQGSVMDCVRSPKMITIEFNGGMR